MNEKLERADRTIGTALGSVDNKLATTNQRLERVEGRLDDTNKKLDTVVQGVMKIPGVRPKE